MTNNYLFLTLILFLMCNSNFSQTKNQVVKSEKEWENQLDNLSFQVLRNSYTERPFTGEYNLHFENGNYNCIEKEWDATNYFSQVIINMKATVDGRALIKQFLIQFNMSKIYHTT